MSGDQIIAENFEVFKSLQLHPIWGSFYETINEEGGRLVLLGDKFAEGGQAKIFNASLEQLGMTQSLRDYKWVLKVFKKGTLLQDLQSQWPCGYLEMMGSGGMPRSDFVALVVRGLLLPSGQFAFLIEKLGKDLRRLIVRKRP
jgi:hypothetical protein